MTGLPDSAGKLNERGRWASTHRPVFFVDGSRDVAGTRAVGPFRRTSAAGAPNHASVARVEAASQRSPHAEREDYAVKPLLAE